MCFLHFSLPSRFRIKILPLPSNAGQFFILSLFLVHQGAASRVESAGPTPCCLKPSLQAPAPPNSNCPLPPLSGSRRLAQRSKAQFRRELQGERTPTSPKTSTLAPHPFSPREPSLTANSFREGRGDLFFKYTDRILGMMEPIKMLGGVFYD